MSLANVPAQPDDMMRKSRKAVAAATDSRIDIPNVIASRKVGKSYRLEHETPRLAGDDGLINSRLEVLQGQRLFEEPVKPEFGNLLRIGVTGYAQEGY